ncbi:MAG: hypothetical protein KZQ84_10305 [Candidatus Thiodiazotropha sp. (ex Lucinoma borealis)]|nr:hypothetical protein [Candidatus Thiodiazotropha sp. (ex Lucinoma borealis)]
MNHKLALWLTICVLVLPLPTSALEEVGTEILNTCLSERQALIGDPTAAIRYGLCLGYLKGIADTLNGTEFCLPETGETAIITQRLKQAYINYALEHKNALRKPAIQIVVPALKHTFPCSR